MPPFSLQSCAMSAAVCHFQHLSRDLSCECLVVGAGGSPAVARITVLVNYCVVVPSAG